MALTEETIQDKIEIVGDYKHVQVRTATVIKRDGVEINQATGTVSGNIYIKSLFTQVTPFILALGGD